MSELPKIIQERQSSRVPFNPDLPITKKDLEKILDAAKWTPTAHNMQNFEIIVIDDKSVLDKIGRIKSRISEEFLRENYSQLSFSKEELLKKKTGILGTMFPPEWTDPAKISDAVKNAAPMPISQSIRGSPTLLIIIYDPRKRAPASAGDVLGFISLGCLMENIWLMTQSLGIGLQILSAFSAPPVETEIKRLVGIPDYMKIAYTCRLGYPTGLSRYFRVRRDIEDFTHHNQYGKKGV